MRTGKWDAFLRALCGLVAVLGATVVDVRADVTTERGASILIFPKVIADGADTTIQISNISNSPVAARCFYVNAQLTNPGAPENPIFNPPLWQETDFEIRLTGQQPTHWVASAGRGVNPFDRCEPDDSPTCVEAPPRSGNFVNLSGLGIDPGAVPPVPSEFIGELRCVQVDPSDGTVIGGNVLTGAATISTRDGDVSNYTAIGIEAADLVGATGNDLQLNTHRGDATPEYHACPAEMILDHFAEGELSDNLVADGTTTVTTELTVVPCSADFEDPQRQSTVTLQFKVYNEFESVLQTSASVTCWKNIRLTDIGNSNAFDRNVLGSDVAETRITPATDGDGGVVGVAEEFHSRGGHTSRAAFNLHTAGDRFVGANGDEFDHIVLPER